MFVKIDHRSTVPIYQQLKTAIIAGILSGELRDGDRLPSVREFARDLGINLHTVRKVYTLLADDGYIVVSRNSGAVVLPPPTLSKSDSDQFVQILLPIIIELRARGIDREAFNSIMSKAWSLSIEKGRDNA